MARNQETRVLDQVRLLIGIQLRRLCDAFDAIDVRLANCTRPPVRTTHGLPNTHTSTTTRFRRVSSADKISAAVTTRTEVLAAHKRWLGPPHHDGSGKEEAHLQQKLRQHQPEVAAKARHHAA